MPRVSSEIIADITDHIGKLGGDFSAWCVGTARDWHSPVLEVHEREEKDDDLIYREAYTPASARAVRDYFVNECGTARGNGDGSEDGKLVYVYKTPPSHPL
jgi:hypothetical protein